MLSIVTITFNNPNELLRTLASIGNSLKDIPNVQREFELIIIDGAEKSQSEPLLANLKRLININYINETDQGIYDAMNKGTRLARGKYIMYLNSGDEIVMGSFLNFKKDMEKITNFGDYVYAQTLINDQMTSKLLPGTCSTLYNFEDHLAVSVCHQSMIFRTLDCLENPYDDTLKIVADYDLKYKLFKFGIGYFSDAYSIIFDVSGVSSSIVDAKSLILRLKETLMMYDRHNLPSLRVVKSLVTHFYKYLRFKIVNK